jgi:hypothetical protein
MKLRLMLGAERLVNQVTKLIGLRVILTPQSSLHSEELSFRADGLLTSHTVNFLEDARFNEVIASIRKEVSHSVYHLYRIYMAMRLADLARKVPGAIFVECGVGEGIITLAMNRYLTDPLPETYLVDTFQGIDIRHLQPKELRGGATNAEEMRQKALKSYPQSDYASIAKRFAAYPHVKLVKGSVPDVLTQNEALFSGKRVAFLHIDMNNAHPEYSALKFFYDRLAVPAFVLLDDYAFKGMRTQKDAIDTACVELGISPPISLPTGQGLIMKTAERH